MIRILIIEDEIRLAAPLADLLEHAGYSASSVHNGPDGLTLAAGGGYDAVILDVMLPGMDGFQILRQLRADHTDTPVLMLTARSELPDRIRGLDAGAYYYLKKPFENEELLACLRTILRRAGDTAGAPLRFSDITLCPETPALVCGGREIALSAKELELMRLLIVNQGQLLSKETLLLKVWGYDCPVNPNSVEAYMSFLRKKLTLLGSAVRIRAVRSLGYRLEETLEKEAAK